MNDYFKVGILIFDDVEVLDFTGPYEVFNVVRYEGQGHDIEEGTPFSVNLVAENKEQVRCRYGLMVTPDEDINQGTRYDIIVVPGGLGARKELHNKKILDWIKNQHETTKLTTSVCTGALLLASAGLLEGKRATTHHNGFDRLENEFKGITVVKDEKYVDEGDIITSGGISAGIDMSLFVVEKLMGKGYSQTARSYMEY